MKVSDGMETNSKDVKTINKMAIAKYIYQKKSATKQEIAYALNMSLPTVFQNIKELEKEGMITSAGQQESTGGRKAVRFSMIENSHYAIGVAITSKHITYLMVNMRGEVTMSKQSLFTFQDQQESYQQIANDIALLIKEEGMDENSILGVGISIAGIVDEKNNLLYRSHALQMQQLDLMKFAQFIDFPLHFFNDANSAAYAQLPDMEHPDFIYISLEATIGGAIYMQGQMQTGDHQKAGEFGHMVLVPNGRSCYCGKKGCFDAYCAEHVLLNKAATLDEFFQRLAAGDEAIKQIWDEYIMYLALAINNLRMIFDMDIVLGGSIRCYLEPYMHQLSEQINQLNTFEQVTSYVKLAHKKQEASAMGAALYFIDQFFS